MELPEQLDEIYQVAWLATGRAESAFAATEKVVQSLINGRTPEDLKAFALAVIWNQIPSRSATPDWSVAQKAIDILDLTPAQVAEALNCPLSQLLDGVGRQRKQWLEEGESG